MSVAISTGNSSNLEKIESYVNDAAYREMLESSSTFNTRLCIERRLRLPFLDSQTGVAQNHSALYANARRRMPGLAPGQIYIFPRPRWRKKRRQYLSMNTRALARAADALLDADGDIHSISQIENPALQDTDSKDSQLLKDEAVAKEWYYDEQDMLEMDNYDEPDADSDLDYEETYSKSKRRRKPGGRGRGTDSPSTPGRKKGSGRGRKKTAHNFEPTPGDPDKPFACELCGARYKTRPGLTYHYGHSHKEGASDDNSRESNAGVPNLLPVGVVLAEGAPNCTPPTAPGPVYQDSYVSFLNQPIPAGRTVEAILAGPPGRRGRQNAHQGPPPPPGSQSPLPPSIPNVAGVVGAPPPPQFAPGPPQAPPNLPPNLPHQAPPPPPIDDPPMPILVPEKIDPIMPMQSVLAGELSRTDKAMPSPYCDFCLGDARENKKTGGSEELVSCSDCGRSGHPTCLQFTDNMKISVRKYRWQCIECKCCSMCGTSDNDDQLLFCDDCDRGYHMYCLSPPLTTPPEGSWSCALCIQEFRK